MPITAARTDNNIRAYGRLASTIPAQIFHPATDEVSRCEIVNISAGGAAIVCSDKLPLLSAVVLYIEGFGRFDATIVRHAEGVFGARFDCRPLKRQRLENCIVDYAVSGLKTPTRLRRDIRRPLLENGYFVCANGKQARYDAVDVSLYGISVITNERPAVGEILNLGKCYGRVSRHHPLGIAIEFVDSSDMPPVFQHGV